MKTAKYLLMGCILLLAAGCELLNTDSDLSVAERLQGRWEVNENTPDFKSTEQFYFVDIQIYAIDENKILIDKFFDIDNGSVVAEINGMTLSLAQQEIGDGYWVYGTGVISGNYKTITWNYYIDEGSGTWHQADAIYTKILN
jgi:hypothetical protein